MAHTIKMNRFLCGSLNRLMSMQMKVSPTSLFNQSRLMVYGGIITTAFGASYMLSSNQQIAKASNANIDLC